MTDDGMPGVGEALDEALMETHHLANLSDLHEARLARRRLVEAQSATSVELTRDRLEQAIEYLELARLERRDTAAGFVQARELVSYAQAGLRRERPVPLTGSPLELVQSEPERETRRTLQELRADTAVNSFEQLRYDVELEDTFRELQRQVTTGEIDHESADDGDLDPEAALRLASLEMDIERSLQRSGDDSEFEFVADDDLAAPDRQEAVPDGTGEAPDGPEGTPDGEGTPDEDIAGDDRAAVREEPDVADEDRESPDEDSGSLDPGDVDEEARLPNLDEFDLPGIEVAAPGGDPESTGDDVTLPDDEDVATPDVTVTPRDDDGGTTRGDVDDTDETIAHPEEG